LDVFSEVVPYTPRVSDMNMAGKVTVTTFALESPKCVFDSFINASDTIWLVITFANAEIWKTIDTWPGRRSGDMIVITVILSALCGVVTVGFLSTVCYEWHMARTAPARCSVEQLKHRGVSQRRLNACTRCVRP
ncbi:PREDICTED: uroplakin-3b-like, partial [Thamnophis sirtalis]|uniref:Uroplakin-3b-like n=1 Tax=Thamnophis sirtalis TaxID=35019 RepID=A0A6I9YGJ6_9SAUR